MNYKSKIIESLNGYFEWLRDVSFAYSNESGLIFQQSNIYYRGQSDAKWDLTPSLFRGNYDEHELINMVLRRLHNKMAKFETNIEKLVFLQHYGMPTRLLDVTFNPLIALFFACNNNPDRRGAIYYGYAYDYQNNQIVNSLADYVFNKDLDDDYFLAEMFFSKNKLVKTILKEPRFFLPPLNNPRIKFQNGAFIIAPVFNEQKELDLFKGHLNDFKVFEHRRAIIPCKCKSQLLRELSVLGFDEGTIYQGMEHEISAIKQETLNKFKLAL